MTFHSPSSLPVYRNAGLREIEAAALAAHPAPSLMERAGRAAAEIARKVSADRGRGVLVIAGPGNNGGDAFVVARHLQAWWFKVDVVFTGEPAKLSEDARAAFDASLPRGDLAAEAARPAPIGATARTPANIPVSAARPRGGPQPFRHERSR